ncbi:hypothetical protein [Methanimicrococcus hongohii]|uniref:hypothetical protein n=1 Tax=Methanimicrococcus hongohii TaxID=3028295 RepID=UPI00292D76AD|nr:hypothetical protein [Methanimicrococcus sp. Hf6]
MFVCSWRAVFVCSWRAVFVCSGREVSVSACRSGLCCRLPIRFSLQSPLPTAAAAAAAARAAPFLFQSFNPNHIFTLIFNPNRIFHFDFQSESPFSL